MPARKSGSGFSFRNHLAPFAPVALALAMGSTGKHNAPSVTSTAAKDNAPTAMLTTGKPNAPGVAAGTFTPVGPLPFAGVRNSPADDHCGIDGGNPDPAKQAEARAKNNFGAATQPPQVITYEELVSLQSQSANIPKRLPDRTMVVSKGEGKFVSYVAFIKDAHYSDVAAGEAVNCNIPGDATNDIHIVLLKDLAQDECMSTTAEMSPHYRPPDWTPANLLKASAGHPVRVQGQLFFDGSHTPCSGNSRPNPKRASLWELHPVYSVEVCTQTTIADCQGSAAEWTSLEDVLGSGQH
jgi:hypothetical protein